jgi:hypothetical protein
MFVYQRPGPEDEVLNSKSINERRFRFTIAARFGGILRGRSSFFFFLYVGIKRQLA